MNFNFIKVGDLDEELICKTVKVSVTFLIEKIKNTDI